MAKKKNGKVTVFVLAIVFVVLSITIIITFSVFFFEPASQINDHISIGPHTGIMLKKGYYDRVLSITGDEEYKHKKHLVKQGQPIKHMHITSDDYGSGITKEVMSKVIRFLSRGVKKNQKILVHCVYGKNRSVSLVVGYLMYKNEWSWKEAYKFVKSKRRPAKVMRQQKHAVIKALDELKSE